MRTFFSEFHKKTKNQLPPIHLREASQSENPTKIALDMVVANQSLTVNHVVDTLKKKNILPMYNAPSTKVNFIKNKNNTVKLDLVNEFEKTTETKIPSN